MVNILPKKEQNDLVTAYYTRLGSAFLILATLAVVIGGALLAPSYILLNDSASASERFTQAVTQTLSLKSKTGGEDTLSSLSEQTTLVNQLTRPPQIPALLSGILAAQGKNIAITKMSFLLEGTGTGTLNLTGTAVSREALVAFVDALKSNSAFANAAVPVQNLAGDSDIPFTLSFAYKLP